MESIYIKALEVYGHEAQISMVFEEMAELQKELCKNMRGKDNAHLIAEEIADVEIMLEQMKILFKIQGLTDAHKDHKIRRLAERLSE